MALSPLQSRKEREITGVVFIASFQLVSMIASPEKISFEFASISKNSLTISILSVFPKRLGRVINVTSAPVFRKSAINIDLSV